MCVFFLLTLFFLLLEVKPRASFNWAHIYGPNFRIRLSGNRIKLWLLGKSEPRILKWVRRVGCVACERSKRASFASVMRYRNCSL